MLLPSSLLQAHSPPLFDEVLTRDSRSRAKDALAICLGALLVLCVSGYQFGRGNHTVYLLDALRYNDPTLFEKDWFVTSTLQYHAAFTRVTAALMRANIVRPAFLVGYLALIVIWQWAWLGIARAIGATRLAYLFSVVLYLISGAGIGLGVYQFLQDGCFLPSNVSNVAMLAAFYCWIIGRRTASGAWFGVAGLFHLNYAVIAVGAWLTLAAWMIYDRRHLRARDALGRSWVLSSVFALAPSLFNVWIALQVKLHESRTSLSMKDFVDVYVHFRHPHHFDPIHYPLALWFAFIWPIPIAIVAWRIRYAGSNAPARRRLREAAKIFALMLSLQLVALLFAGVWYISETLVQLMLWRFSIYVKLLSCLGAAWVICDAKYFRPATQRAIFAIPAAIILIALVTIGLASRLMQPGVSPNESITVMRSAVANHWPAILLFGILSMTPLVGAIFREQLRTVSARACLTSCLILALFVAAGWKNCFGWGMTPELVDAAYLRVCEWAKNKTPRDAVFVVPPAETAFRLEANRAVVVNYKHVPQLGAELVEWLQRLESVVGVDDVTKFPRDYAKTMIELNAKYEARPPAALIETAERWHARFIIVDHPWPARYETGRVYGDDVGGYFVYDVELIPTREISLQAPPSIAAKDHQFTSLPAAIAH